MYTPIMTREVNYELSRQATRLTFYDKSLKLGEQVVDKTDESLGHFTVTGLFRQE